MRNTVQRGFTLIELVVVIVILGILAATALPKFIDLSTDANTAAVKGFAGAIAGGNNVNYAAYLARRTDTTGTTATSGVQNTQQGCSLTVANLLLQANMPTSPVYSVSGGSATTMGLDVTCVLSNGTSTANFVITGAK